MSMEAFLINPARRGRKSSTGKRRRRGGVLPSGLLSRMIKTYGIKRGMKEAWKAHRSGVRNPRPKLPAAYHIRGRKHRPVVYGSVKKGSYTRSPYSRSPRINPFGEEVMIVGNPRQRRIKKRRSSLRNDPGPKLRRHRRSYSMRSNPVHRVSRQRHRRFRGNPASKAMAISYRRPMSLIVPAIAGTGGFFVADYVPTAIGMSASPLTRIGIKAGVAFGGGMLVSKFVGAKAGAAFAIGAGINLFNDVLRTYVFKTAVAGIGAFVQRPRLRGVGAMGPYSQVSSPYTQ